MTVEETTKSPDVALSGATKQSQSVRSVTATTAAKHRRKDDAKPAGDASVIGTTKAPSAWHLKLYSITKHTNGIKKLRETFHNQVKQWMKKKRSKVAVVTMKGRASIQKNN